MIGGPTSGNPTLSPSITNVVPIGTHTSFTGSGRPSIIPGLSSSGSRCKYLANTYEQRHEISNNVVCATSEASDQPAHTHSLI